MAGVGRKKPGPEINVVPLVDVCLVLLIIFMVVSHMLQKGIEVNLPSASHALEKDQRTSTDLIVSITKEGALYLEKDRLSALELRTAITSILAAEPFRGVLLKGDESLDYGQVKKVMLLCQKAGARMINIAAEPPKRGDRDDDSAAAVTRSAEGA